MAENYLNGAFLPLFLDRFEKQHGVMEFIALAVIVLLVLAASATVFLLRGDGRGHTPPVVSKEPWQAEDLPSSAYSLRSSI